MRYLYFFNSVYSLVWQMYNNSLRKETKMQCQFLRSYFLLYNKRRKILSSVLNSMKVTINKRKCNDNYVWIMITIKLSVERVNENILTSQCSLIDIKWNKENILEKDFVHFLSLFQLKRTIIIYLPLRVNEIYQETANYYIILMYLSDPNFIVIQIHLWNDNRTFWHSGISNIANLTNA